MLINTWFTSVWIFCCTIVLCVRGEQSPKRVCYFHNWAQYRQGAARYTVANAGLQHLCTHLVYAYAHFNTQGKLQPAFGDAEFSVYAQFNALKDHSPEDLKTLLAVGGWNFGSRKFSVLAGDPTSRTRFVTSAVTFLRQHGFDGLELSWESPGSRGGAPEDRENLALLCTELKAAFEAEAPGSQKRLMLSASAPASPKLMDVGYDIQALDSCLDLWTPRTYALHGAWEGVTGHHSPLYAASNVTEAQASASVEWTAQQYVTRGASRHKVMMGLSTSGTAFRLTSSWRHSPGSPASLGPAGTLTKEPGFWAYYEVCQRISNGSGVVRRDDKQRVPYYVDGDLWISYEDEDSITEKTNWLKQNGYGGFALRALDTDVFDPARLCVSSSPLSPYPLLSAATATLLSPSTSTTSSSQHQHGESGTMESSTQRSSGAGQSDPETAATAPGAENGSQTGAGSQAGSQTGSGTGGGGSQTGVSGSQTGGSGSQTGGSGSQTGGSGSPSGGSGSWTGGGGSQTGGSGSPSGGSGSWTGGGGSQTGGSGSQSGGSGSWTGGSGSQKGFPCEGRPYTTYGDPSSPCGYVVCWANVPHYKTCPPGQVFHPDLRACRKPQQPAPC